MIKKYIEDEVFENIDFSKTALPKGNYDHCRFINCDFSNSNLNNSTFSECVLKGCNLSMCKLSETALKDVRFEDCKILGVYFEHCAMFMFQVRFENCTLNLSSFFGLSLKQTQFKNTALQDVDFSEADLSNAIFADCDLLRATFSNTNLEKADLRSAVNYNINPEQNRIKKAKFSYPSVLNLLDKYGIEVS